jgi:hypothetical protein
MIGHQGHGVYGEFFMSKPVGVCKPAETFEQLNTNKT